MDVAYILSNRIPAVTRNLVCLLLLEKIFAPFREAFRLGWHSLTVSCSGRLLLASFVVFACFAVFLFPAEEFTVPIVISLLQVLLIGLAWILLSMLPIVLVKSQPVEIRTL